MRIRVVAEAPSSYESWRIAQRQSALAPATDLEQRGKSVFDTSACPLCHTIRGTDSHGSAGPDLTHVASRQKIAGATLDNNASNLELWVTHARSVKLEAQMPNLPQIRGDDLRAVVAYLRSLR
jgi:cytochrome c oxidase subunit 2